ncbi:hypothetical protein BC829DRAFT_440224 [Chytridium lagenaria]|nr:hypothetical protein BC829DRAFT_440224 [Chytridium lagenaria]
MSLPRRHSIYGYEDRVVLDIGSQYIKCGLSGEHKPRHIIPFTLPVPHLGSQEFARMGSKNMIVGILFEILQVPSITFIHSGLLALMTAGKMSGLVIDSGHLETTVVPFYEGRPLLHNLKTIPKAGQSVTHRLKLLIRNHGTPQDVHMDVDAVPPEMWEDMKARICFVGRFPQIMDVSGENRELVYPYRERAIPYTIYRSEVAGVTWRFGGGERVGVPGWVRERAAEILFEGDDDGESVGVDCCPIDIRTEMMENILLAGGTAMLPGFQARLLEHFKQLLETSPQYTKIKRLSTKVKIIKTVFMSNCLSWIGGSLVGSIKNGGVEVLREGYLRDRKVPDWTSINSREEVEAQEVLTY